MPEAGPETPRRIAFVVGSGRSGTSTMSGTLQTLGMHVPQPEVSADATNPRGFGEPKWIVDFHERLLKRTHVQTADARPDAWFLTGQLATKEPIRNELHAWLETQFDEAAKPTPDRGDGTTELVIKDPRSCWFLGLWRGAAIRARAETSYITMLRPPTEVVGSKQKYYAGAQSEISRTAGWVNVMLHTELSTREAPRAFVRYADLLADWTVPVNALGARLEYAAVQTASPKEIRSVHSFIDPALRRVQITWDDLSIPARLQELAEETWQALDSLAGPDADPDDAATRATLDQLREAYTDYYGEAEAVAQSSAAAAKAAGIAEAREKWEKAARASTPDPAAGDPLAKVPHGLRAMVPAGARRAVRQRLEGRSGGERAKGEQ